MKTLLTTTPLLMIYYLIILGAFALISTFILNWRFRSSSLHRMMRDMHAFFINIGGSLLTAFRAALGAMTGFLIAWCFRDVEEMSAAGVAGAIGYAALTLVVCVGLAWADELLRNPHAVSRYS
ncbi:TPA: hypothetical protein R8F97_003485 [Pseudomonas putida]|nr:hypothetical protein [Pseudomonas putida]